MAIMRCRVCGQEYDADWHVEHEDECMLGDFIIEIRELEKMGVVNGWEIGKFLNELEQFSGDELENAIKSIKLDLSKRKL